MIRKFLIAAMLGASMAAITTPAAAVVYVRVAPPAPQVEPVPEMRRGYVWVPGYWQWRHQRHVWVAGSWLRERPGYRYNSPNWEERNGRWMMRPGRWARGDRDGDGVPNGKDRHPSDPTRN